MFELSAPYQPAGDQPASDRQADRRRAGRRATADPGGRNRFGQDLHHRQRHPERRKPTLVISHNKTLAAQLYAEFKSFFPRNAVEYFVSYFDYYQPEAYIPRTDTFIEKDSSINEEIERLRLSTMSSLLTRRDVIVVASVSCIYGIGSKENYEALIEQVRDGMDLSRDQLLGRLVDLQYTPQRRGLRARPVPRARRRGGTAALLDGGRPAPGVLRRRNGTVCRASIP